MLDAAFRLMWQKLFSRAFAVVLVVYIASLWALVLHDYMTERQAVATVWTPRTNFNIVIMSNAVVSVSWKTSMTISPRAKVNAEDISVGHVVIRRQSD